MYNLKFVAIIAESYSGKEKQSQQQQQKHIKSRERSERLEAECMSFIFRIISLYIWIWLLHWFLSKCVVKLNLGSDSITIHNDLNIEKLNSINILYWIECCRHSTLRNPNWIWFVLSMKCIFNVNIVRICFLMLPTELLCVFVGEWKI